MPITQRDDAHQHVILRRDYLWILLRGDVSQSAHHLPTCMPTTSQIHVMLHVLEAIMLMTSQGDAYQVHILLNSVCPSTPAYFGDQVTKRCRLACPE